MIHGTLHVSASILAHLTYGLPSALETWVTRRAVFHSNSLMPSVATLRAAPRTLAARRGPEEPHLSDRPAGRVVPAVHYVWRGRRSGPGLSVTGRIERRGGGTAAMFAHPVQSRPLRRTDQLLATGLVRCPHVQMSGCPKVQGPRYTAIQKTSVQEPRFPNIQSSNGTRVIMFMRPSVQESKCTGIQRYAQTFKCPGVQISRYPNVIGLCVYVWIRTLIRTGTSKSLMLVKLSRFPQHVV